MKITEYCCSQFTIIEMDRFISKCPRLSNAGPGASEEELDSLPVPATNVSRNCRMLVVTADVHAPPCHSECEPDDADVIPSKSFRRSPFVEVLPSSNIRKDNRSSDVDQSEPDGTLAYVHGSADGKYLDAGQDVSFSSANSASFDPRSMR